MFHLYKKNDIEECLEDSSPFSKHHDKISPPSQDTPPVVKKIRALIYSFLLQMNSVMGLFLCMVSREWFKSDFDVYFSAFWTAWDNLYSSKDST